MKGLILKDFINLKKNAKIFGALSILYAVMAVAGENSSIFSTIFTMLFAFLTLSLYSYDDMAKWDSFALTMPVSRDNIVQGKYLMMLLLTFIGIVYSSLFTVIINGYFKTDSIFQGFESIGAGAAIVVFFYSILIPFITKLGVEKSRFILFTIYFIPFIIVVACSKLADQINFTVPYYLVRLAGFVVSNIYIIVPVVLILALGISYRISLGIYRKKEF
jgi:hypothetical protein